MACRKKDQLIELTAAFMDFNVDFTCSSDLPGVVERISPRITTDVQTLTGNEAILGTAAPRAKRKVLSGAQENFHFSARMQNVTVPIGRPQIRKGRSKEGDIVNEA